MQAGTPEERVRQLFQALLDAFGPQHWWPARTPLEVIIGSILVQNTAWTNAEKALHRLRSARALSLRAMRSLPLFELEQLIRPAGFFRQKSRTIQSFVAFIDREYAGSLDAMARQHTNVLRLQLLGICGVGPETADSILLYAAQHPVFVVDAYARRVLFRHGLIAEDASYTDVQKLGSAALADYLVAVSHPPTHNLDSHTPTPMSRKTKSQAVEAFNEMHGLLVAIGKRFCRKAAPDCNNCPLLALLPLSARARVPGI
jgi:endonuclease III related protein